MRCSLKNRFVPFTAALLMLCMSAAGQPLNDSSPVYVWNRAIKSWASECRVVRGYVRIDDPAAGLASFGTDSDGTGRADNIVVSLGDGGMAVVSFGEPFGNKPGPDFAVFENSFDGKYLELAFVEVSSDSIRWVRFPSRSTTPASPQTGGFGTTDPENIHNLAGKYTALFGTPFWLEDLADSTGVDINSIMYIRIIDVVGSVNPLYATYDSEGRIINDPWPTPFPQSGFDLDAVALIDISLVGIEDNAPDKVRVFPVPANQILFVETSALTNSRVRILDLWGKLCSDWRYFSGTTDIATGRLGNGIYIVQIESDDSSVPHFIRFIKSGPQ